MPVELSELLNDERWVEVEWGRNTFNVAYRPGHITLLRQAEIEKEMRLLKQGTEVDEVEAAQRIGIMFCEAVCDWDLTDNGKPLPVTPEIAVGKLGMAILYTIMDAIGEDGKARKEEKKALSANSGAISKRAEKSAVARNGIPSSERADSWA